MVRKPKASLALNGVRTVKGSKKGFHRYTTRKSKTREHVGELPNKAEELMTTDMERARVLNACFISAFTDRICLQESQAPETICPLTLNRGNI